MEKTGVNGHNRRHDNDLGNGYRKVPLDVVSDEDTDSDSDTRCGIGACKPGCLQVFSNMVSFSLYYGLSSLVTSALSMYLTSQVTTLERQFGMSSSETGMLLSMNDFGFLIFVLVVSHLTRYAHKPRILGVCVVAFGCSAIFSAVPHFISPEPFIPDNNSTNLTVAMQHQLTVDKFSGESLCVPKVTSLRTDRNMTSPPDQMCSRSEEQTKATSKLIALGIISAGMFMQGIAKSPRMALTQTYIDDNVVKTKTGIYIGLIACLSIFGPATAFAVGAKISRIYVTLQDTHLSTKDPRWIGAWWLGFIVFGIVAILISGPLFLFPRRMVIKSKNVEKQRHARALQLQRDEAQGLFAKVKDLPVALWRLVTNFTYISILVASTLDFFCMAGGISFAPKFFEVYFGLSVYKANMIMGTTTIVAASTGMLAGGILTTKLKLKLVGCIKLMIVARSISGIISTIPLFLDCPPPYIEGLEQYGMSSTFPPRPPVSQSSCLGCSCHGSAYFPVCGSDGRNYFSPCVAGCSQKMGYLYSNCTCVSNTTTTSAPEILGVTNSTEFTATPGLCSSECNLLTIFIVTQVIAAFCGTTSAMPHTVASLRSVEERDKTLSVGLSSFLQSVFGWMLGPVVFGYIVDSTCSLWHNSCSKRGSCAIYDSYDLRNKLHGIGIGGRLICIVLFTLCLIRLLYTAKGKEFVERSNNAHAPKDAEDAEQKEKMVELEETHLEPVRVSSL
ncbi:solute carrier organic anion transporter family member 2A1-like [Liolophura sinensis]|uniref:solute carrier organic anion transporter family member 2A1-like n=1 Tax=Liolophura sinensis TaxID=3198878 RepID=UPI0031597A69